MTEEERVDRLIEASSLGTPSVKAVRRRTPDDVARWLVADRKSARSWPRGRLVLHQNPRATWDELSKEDSGMSPRNERHVTQHPDGGWQVVKPGSDRASARTETQAEAIDRAREILGNDGGGENVIHGRDGRIRDSDTVAPGNDPYPPKDRK